MLKPGYPNGKNLPEITLYTTTYYTDICTSIQKQLSEIGIKVKVEITQPVNFISFLNDSKMIFFKLTWVADYPDPISFLSIFYSKNFPPGPNYFKFSNQDYDNIYEKAVVELNDTIRMKYYDKMEKIIFDEAPIVPLFYDRIIRFAWEDIKGIDFNPMNVLVLKKVDIK